MISHDLILSSENRMHEMVMSGFREEVLVSGLCCAVFGDIF